MSNFGQGLIQRYENSQIQSKYDLDSKLTDVAREFAQVIYGGRVINEQAIHETATAIRGFQEQLDRFKNRQREDRSMIYEHDREIGELQESRKSIGKILDSITLEALVNNWLLERKRRLKAAKKVFYGKLRKLTYRRLLLSYRVFRAGSFDLTSLGRSIALLLK